MKEWLRKFATAQPPPLTGAPAVRRQKTYSAQSGYVYQYVYMGSRPAERRGTRGTQYVFEASADRKRFFSISVFLETPAVWLWEQGHGRSLSATEHYAAAKLALFQAFDERESPAQMQDEIAVRERDLAVILETLGIE
jgi:hypothetical protein